MKECLILMDMDGTLLDTDSLHYKAYNHVLTQYGIDISWKQFEECIQTSNTTLFLESLGISKDLIPLVREQKLQTMLTMDHIAFLPGAAEFLEWCLNHHNLVIVTSTPRRVVESFQKHLPLLQKVTNWVCKEDCTRLKPHSECYELAISRYGKENQTRIGYENTLMGFQALHALTNHTFFIQSPTYKIVPTTDRVTILTNYIDHVAFLESKLEIFV
jgi:beta-phosphoglucomutase-like phosphatase (HAD superfamily)